MDNFSKLIRIALRVGDEVMKADGNEARVDGVRLVGMNDDSRAEVSGNTVRIVGDVRMEPESETIENKTILVEKGSFHGNLKNCVFKGNGEFHGEFSGRNGSFEGGVFAKGSVFKEGRFNGGKFDGGIWVDGHARWQGRAIWNSGTERNGSLETDHPHGESPDKWEFYISENANKDKIEKFGIDNTVVFPDMLFPNDRQGTPFTGKIMLGTFDQKAALVNNDPTKGDYLLVKNADFQFMPPKNKKGLYSLVWNGGTIENAMSCKIPFSGTYNDITAQFMFGIFITKTENATFTYNENKGMEWVRGATKNSFMVFNGHYGIGQDGWFTGSIIAGRDKAIVRNARVTVESGKITDINAADCDAVVASNVTTQDGRVGNCEFKCNGASLEYANRSLEWKTGDLSGGKVIDCKWRDGEFKDGIWVSGLWMADDSKWKGGKDGNGTTHPAGESPRKWTFDVVLDNETDTSSSAFAEKYKDRYDIMKDYILPAGRNTNFSDMSQFGKLEEVLVERKVGNQIDAIYDTGIRVIYCYDKKNIRDTIEKDLRFITDSDEARRKVAFRENMGKNGKIPLMVKSIEFIDAATLRTIYEQESVFVGFDRNGRPLASKEKQTWIPSKELIASVVTITKNGLFDSETMKSDPTWYLRHKDRLDANFAKDKKTALSKEYAELEQEWMRQRVFIDAWKYDMFVKKRDNDNIFGLLHSATYRTNKNCMQYREMFNRAISRYGYKPVSFD